MMVTRESAFSVDGGGKAGLRVDYLDRLRRAQINPAIRMSPLTLLRRLTACMNLTHRNWTFPKECAIPTSSCVGVIKIQVKSESPCRAQERPSPGC